MRFVTSCYAILLIGKVEIKRATINGTRTSRTVGLIIVQPRCNLLENVRPIYLEYTDTLKQRRATKWTVRFEIWLKVAPTLRSYELYGLIVNTARRAH